VSASKVVSGGTSGISIDAIEGNGGEVSWKEREGKVTLDAVEATALLGDEAANTWRAWTESSVWAVTIGTTATATSASLMTGRGKKEVEF